MTAQQPDIQWYIARDGKQHGPLSDVEMRTFVAQGHLKPTDLIWRPGFADWRPAPTVFPFQSPEQAVTAPLIAATRPSVAPARAHAPEPERSFEPKRIRAAQEPDDRQPSRTSRMIGLGLVLLLLLAGGGWYLWQKGSKGGQAASSEAAATVPSDTAPAAAPAQTAELAPGIEAPSSTAVDAGAEALDAKFQQTPMWSVVKREFPDWYGERLREAAKLTAEKQPEIAISKHLAESLVTLRRQHAKDALAASTPKLMDVANAFLNNLKSLGARSVGACYGFISQGETAPVVLDLINSPDQGAALQAQVAAIFEAIADGRRTPTAHDRAVKTDYEVLVAQLTKLGWKEDDLKTFSNPTALSKEPPGRVCQMVQDWFVAHLSVEDKAAQERLLVETLKPVVSG
jgi:hypothetical protein